MVLVTPVIGLFQRGLDPQIETTDLSQGAWGFKEFWKDQLHLEVMIQKCKFGAGKMGEQWRVYAALTEALRGPRFSSQPPVTLGDPMPSSSIHINENKTPSKDSVPPHPLELEAVLKAQTNRESIDWFRDVPVSGSVISLKWLSPPT